MSSTPAWVNVTPKDSLYDVELDVASAWDAAPEKAYRHRRRALEHRPIAGGTFAAYAAPTTGWTAGKPPAPGQEPVPEEDASPGLCGP